MSPGAAQELTERVTVIESKVTEVQSEVSTLKEHYKEDRQMFIEALQHSKKYEDYIDQQIEQERARAEFWRGAAQQILVLGVWASIGLICSAVWIALKEAFKS